MSDEEQAAVAPAAEAPEEQSDPMETALLVMGLELNTLASSPVASWPGLVQRHTGKRANRCMRTREVATLSYFNR